MKNVKDFIGEIANLGLNHDIVGDTEQEEIVLSYLNLAYNEVITSQYAKSNPQFMAIKNATVVDGVSDFVEPNYAVMSVVDTAQRKKLEIADYDSLEAINPVMDDEGNPTKYYFVGSALHTYPSNNTNLRVRYLKKQDELTLDTPMSDVLIPAEFHSVLLWGTLYYLAFDERDFSFTVNAQITGDNYRLQKTKLITNAYYNKQKPDTTRADKFLEG